MRAVQIRHFGGYEELEVSQQPTPVAGPGQVVVRVRAAGINLADTLIRRNRYAVTPDLPLVLGNEVAGTVHDVGSTVRGIRVGARVAAPLFFPGGYSGGYADYATVDAGLVVPLPNAVGFEEATALMIQGLTALYLTRHISPRGKTVLVNAAAGGVGSLLIQLLKRAGAKKIIAGASTQQKLDFAKSWGADVGVIYTQPDWVTRARWATDGVGPDIVYESVGGAVTKGCLEVLAPGGDLVIYGALNIQSFDLGVPELLGLIFKNQSLTGFAVMPLLTRETLLASLAELFQLAAAGELKVKVGGSYPLERAGEAHRTLEERGSIGKLVLVP